MSNRHTKGKRELIAALDRRNISRALGVSLFFAAAIPVFLIVLSITKAYGEEFSGIKVFLILSEVLFIGTLGLDVFLLLHNEVDKFGTVSRVNFAISDVFIIAFATIDHSKTGSILMYVIGAALAAGMPVLLKKERRKFIYPFACAMFISACASGSGARSIIDVVITDVIFVICAHFVQSSIIEHEMLNIRYKTKTITAESDPLTGLNNRRGLVHKVSAVLPYCVRNHMNAGIIEIDIDFFKKYNDRFGHPKGDECLKKVAGAIKRAADRGSDVVARTGGEEFIVFAQNMDESEMISLAMSIREEIAALRISHAGVGTSEFVTVSMGIGIVDSKDAFSFDEIYDIADRALYEAKANGRNCIVCENKIYGRMRNGLATVIAQ